MEINFNFSLQVNVKVWVKTVEDVDMTFKLWAQSLIHALIGLHP